MCAVSAVGLAISRYVCPDPAVPVAPPAAAAPVVPVVPVVPVAPLGALLSAPGCEIVALVNTNFAVSGALAGAGGVAAVLVPAAPVVPVVPVAPAVPAVPVGLAADVLAAAALADIDDASFRHPVTVTVFSLDAAFA